jgi:serine/threonine-protein kinase RsbT
MPTTRSERYPVRSSPDIVAIRQAVRTWCLAIGMGLVDLTKIVTAASEIARNTLEYGKGGTMQLEELRDGLRAGVRLTFEDIPRAMTDGFTSGNGMGLGLGGTKRLTDDFLLESTPGRGTRVVITKWKSRA